MRPAWAHPLAHDYQVKVAEFCLLDGDGTLELPGVSVKKVGRSTYINLDMGLGKTLITLMILKALKMPGLVIAPIRAVHNTWPQETEKWYPELTYAKMHGPKKNEAYSEKRDLYFTNPESTKWFEAKRVYQMHPARVLVIDEGSMWKAHNSVRFKLMKRMRKLYHNRIFILSGTPNPQSYLNLWSQYYILDGGQTLGTSYNKYRDQFFNQLDRDGFVFGLKILADKAIQNLVAPKTIRLDAMDHIKMPSVHENEIQLTLPKELMAMYKELEKEYVLTIPDTDVSVDAFNSAALSSKLRQFTQGFLYVGEGKDREAMELHHLKLDAAASLIEEVDTPFLLAFEFKHEQKMLRDRFGDIPIVAGGTDERQATRWFQEWNAGDLPLLACHPASVSHSLNLQYGPSTNILWLALTWSLEKYLQFIARMARQGQKSSFINVHHLTIAGTVDTKVSRALRDRKDVQKAFNDYLRGLVNYG